MLAILIAMVLAVAAPILPKNHPVAIEMVVCKEEYAAKDILDTWALHDFNAMLKKLKIYQGVGMCGQFRGGAMVLEETATYDGLELNNGRLMSYYILRLRLSPASEENFYGLSPISAEPREEKPEERKA
jgi:hypothetical protein